MPPLPDGARGRFQRWRSSKPDRQRRLGGISNQPPTHSCQGPFPMRADNALATETPLNSRGIRSSFSPCPPRNSPWKPSRDFPKTRVGGKSRPAFACLPRSTWAAKSFCGEKERSSPAKASFLNWPEATDESHPLALGDSRFAGNFRLHPPYLGSGTGRSLLERSLGKTRRNPVQSGILSTAGRLGKRLPLRPPRETRYLLLHQRAEASGHSNPPRRDGFQPSPGR